MDDNLVYCTGAGCYQPVEMDDVVDGHSPCCGEPVADTEEEAASY